MRKLLNTLYVTTPEAYLARDGENVVVRVNSTIKFRIPVHNLEGIIGFGFSGASPSLIQLCCERGVGITFLSPYGRFLGRVIGKLNGNVLLRRTQYRWADQPDTALRLSKRFLLAKLLNSKKVLNRALRDHPDVVDRDLLEKTISYFTKVSKKIEHLDNLDSIRGIEGEAASNYFQCMNELILHQKEDFRLINRNRRPPLDRINALLSFLYSILAHDVTSALESVGLDPQVGYLHKDRPGRASLSLDLMEELRAYLVDRLTLNLINRKQVSPKGFQAMENGAVIMDENTRKEVLTAWQKRKQEEITHPFLEEKIPLGLIPYVQSMLLSRHMRGDLDDYPPFFWR